MSEQHDKKATGIEPKERVKQPDLTRRRIARAGLAAPVILTMASKQSLANSFNCTLSGWTTLTYSVAPSAHGAPQACNFKSPGGWHKRESWPAALNPDQPFYLADSIPNGLSGVFSTLNIADSKLVPQGADPVVKLIDVMPHGPHNSAEFAKHTIAALLNSLTRGDYPLEPLEVISIYNAVAGGGSYTTSFGAVLDIQDAMNFFLHIQEGTDPANSMFYYTPPAGV